MNQNRLIPLPHDPSLMSDSRSPISLLHMIRSECRVNSDWLVMTYLFGKAPQDKQAF